MGILADSTQGAEIPVAQRRLLVLVLNIGTTVPLLWAIYQTFKPSGIISLDAIILVCTACCVPWPVITFWNVIISLFILAFGNPAKSIYPYFDATGPLPEISSKTALAFCLRNEDPKPLFNRLYAMQESLRNTGQLQHFRFVLLSDTSDPAIAKEEEEGFAQVRDNIAKGMGRAPVYRRRCKNTGYKAGNIKAFLDDHHSSDDEFFVTLDQDSAMGGDLLVRMVSSMEKHPRIGLLQTICIGMPAVSAFTRLFQFGNRYSMRTYILGNSWWTDDCALYWGHNAIIRTAPFHKYCMLPKLPGEPPLGGYILSHDFIEAMFMRRAGYEVRLIPIDTESYETQPPTLIEYLRRELRWCQGIMQYWFLLREPGLALISRLQVYQMLASYLHHAASLLLAFASIANALRARVDSTAPVAITFALPSLIILFVSSACKIAGILDTTLNHPGRYGGMGRWSLSIVVETLLIFPLSAVTSMAVAYFLLTLLVGNSVPWDGQNRDRLGLRWRNTFEALCPQTLIGLGISILMWKYCEVPAPLASIWALTLALAVPFAVFTASPWFARFATRWRLFMIPEEVLLPRLLSTLMAPEIKPFSVASAIKSTK